MDYNIIAIAAIVLSLGWWAFNIERCYRQRISIINKQHEYALELIDRDLFDEWDKFRSIDLIPYDQHMWYLMTFRDPIKMYDPVIQELMGK